MKKVRQRNDNNVFRNNNTELILNYLWGMYLKGSAHVMAYIYFPPFWKHQRADKRFFKFSFFFLVLCYLISIKWSAGIRRVRGTKAFFVEVAVLMMTEVEPVFVHHGSERLRWLCRGFRSWTSRLNHMLPQTNEGCTLSSFSLLSPPASLIMELLSEFCLFSHCQPCLKQRFATLHILSVGNSDEMALLKLFHFMTPERVVKMDVLITTIH